LHHIYFKPIGTAAVAYFEIITEVWLIKVTKYQKFRMAINVQKRGTWNTEGIL